MRRSLAAAGTRRMRHTLEGLIPAGPRTEVSPLEWKHFPRKIPHRDSNKDVVASFSHPEPQTFNASPEQVSAWSVMKRRNTKTGKQAKRFLLLLLQPKVMASHSVQFAIRCRSAPSFLSPDTVWSFIPTSCLRWLDSRQGMLEVGSVIRSRRQHIPPCICTKFKPFFAALLDTTKGTCSQ